MKVKKRFFFMIILLALISFLSKSSKDFLLASPIKKSRYSSSEAIIDPGETRGKTSVYFHGLDAGYWRDSADPFHAPGISPVRREMTKLSPLELNYSDVLQQLVSPEVNSRSLPKALDFMAVLGSKEAEKILDSQGVFNFLG